MTERTIDLDALAADLKAADVPFMDIGEDHERWITPACGLGFSPAIYADGLYDGGNYNPIRWHAIDIIRRHVSPPAGKPAGDVVTIPADLAARAADELEMISREPSNWVASVNQQKADAAAIRAALEGQSIPDLHAKLLDIFNANTTSYGAGNATCSDFDGVAAADAILQLFGYPAVERPTREATPVEEGEMPW